METLTTSELKREETRIPSESTHWYKRDGSPCYQVPRAKGDGMRDTTLADARKLDLVPSVSVILKCAAAPGLEQWKLRKMLEAALTLPRHDGESLDDFAERVITDSQEQGRKAAQRGTDLHAAIEEYIRGNLIIEFAPHVKAVSTSLCQHGIDMECGKAEHSFACGAGYGGKVDWHNDDLLLDFKSKDRIDEKIKPYPEQLMQCAAYAYGLGLNRAGNVFIGVEDKQVRVFLYEKKDLDEAFLMFECLLRFWQRKNRFGIYEKK